MIAQRSQFRFKMEQTLFHIIKSNFTQYFLTTFSKWPTWSVVIGPISFLSRSTTDTNCETIVTSYVSSYERSCASRLIALRNENQITLFEKNMRSYL